MNPVARGWQVLCAQGPQWAAFRLLHALKEQSGWFERRYPCVSWNATPGVELTHRPFIRIPSLGEGAETEAEQLLAGHLKYFSRHDCKVGFPPAWFRDPFTGREVAADQHWSRVSALGADDIKVIWEPSRMTFLCALARGYAATRNEAYPEAFWRVVEDWAVHNPPNRGPNWRCGQEVALRLILWVFAYDVFRSARTTTSSRRAALGGMIRVAGERIGADIGYALSQQNNHGISEAAGLFTAGIVLGDREWARHGWRLLERQAGELIYDDGSFSQHSTNYHRLVLQLYLWAIQLGRANGYEPTATLVSRVRNAGRWLLAMTDETTGRVPNLGGNDGAHLFPLSDCDYLDHRPTAQAVGAVLDGGRWLPSGRWDELAEWLGAAPNKAATPPDVRRSLLFADGGYALLFSRTAKAILRCPTRFRHRPAHCDLLHVDVWADGENILCDGGSYSYNTDPPWRDYFPGVPAHNTVQFDNGEQMPRLGPFLYGRWPRMKSAFVDSNSGAVVEASYVDWRGNGHERRLEATADGFRVIDHIHGFSTEAVVRWRLAPELAWTLNGDACGSSRCRLSISCEGGRADLVVVKGWESLGYLQRQEIPVLEARVPPSVRTVVSEIRLTGGN